MFISAKQAALTLQMELHRVYYLLAMGEIEAVRISGRGTGENKTWRLSADAVNEYAKRNPGRKIKEVTSHFIYPGDSGSLFSFLQNCSSPDTGGKTSFMERRRRQSMHSPQRPDKILFSKLKPVTQMELFSS